MTRANETIHARYRAKANALLRYLIAASLMLSAQGSTPGMTDVFNLFGRLRPWKNRSAVETPLDGVFLALEKAAPGCYAARKYTSLHHLPY